MLNLLSLESSHNTTVTLQHQNEYSCICKHCRTRWGGSSWATSSRLHCLPSYIWILNETKLQPDIWHRFWHQLYLYFKIFSFTLWSRIVTGNGLYNHWSSQRYAIVPYFDALLHTDWTGNTAYFSRETVWSWSYGLLWYSWKLLQGWYYLETLLWKLVGCNKTFGNWKWSFTFCHGENLITVSLYILLHITVILCVTFRIFFCPKSILLIHIFNYFS